MRTFLWTSFLVVGASFLLLALGSLSWASDAVSLQTGGVLHGNVTKSRETVAVTTATGARIVLDRASVKTVRHQPNARTNPHKLTPAQKEWFPKVRRLLNQADGQNPQAAGRALRDLRAIHEVDAIPALSEYLRTSNNEQVRQLYVRILGDMRGTNAVVALIEEALFDSSFLVRTAAQEATKKQEPQNVRPYYDQALRYPNRGVICRAASVLATVGDKENVPALIDALYSRTVDLVIRPSCCMNRVAYLMLPRGGSLNQPYLMTSLVERPELRPEVHWVPNPEVREALERITKQSYGYDTAAWRRWWMSEQLAESKRRKFER